MNPSCRVLALSVSVIAGCAAEDGGAMDASVQGAQPSCGAFGMPCASNDAGAPPGTNPGASSGGNSNNNNVPATVDAGGSVSPPADAGSARDAGSSAMDAGSAPVDAGAPDAVVVPSGDAQVTGQNDAAPAGDGGGAYPPVADVSAMGPYTTMTITSTGPGGAYTIFRPSELAPNGVLNPIVSWGNGGATWPSLYAQLPHFASHGFVVVAADDPLVTGAEVKAGIDWIVQQNETSGSPYYKKLDVKRVAGVGYSAGGLATLEVADDPRFLTIVIISGANTTDSARTMNMPKLHTPIAYLCTDDDASKGNCAADFAVSKQPSFFGVMKGTGHVDVALGGAAVKLSATGTTAWLRWQLMGDQSYKSWFVGADCKLCKDSAWTVMQKNLQ
jgi:hypothetical protein